MIYVYVVELKTVLVDQSQNDTIHTNESYRSPLNSVSSCRDTQFDMFHSQKSVILIIIMFSDDFFHCMTTDFPPNGSNMFIR